MSDFKHAKITGQAMRDHWGPIVDRIADEISDNMSQHCPNCEAQAAEIERLRGIGLHLVQHINWVTNGLPDLLEDACLTDEEGVINAAIAAATEARAALGEME